MPLLFKNGKLVVNDIDQLVFSEDPDSCRCCPGLCECPPDADYAVPKYVQDASFSVSNVPDTYSSELNRKVTRRYSNGQVFQASVFRQFTVSGLSALNGTYPHSLEDQYSPGTPCVQPDPFPACAFDANPNCVWYRTIPIVPITGSFTNVENDSRFGFPYINESFFITGTARAIPFPTDLGAIEIYMCLRDGSYSGNVKHVFFVSFRNVYKSTTNVYVPQILEKIINGFEITRRNCDDGGFWGILPPGISYPGTMLSTYVSIEQTSTCLEFPSIRDSIYPYRCYDSFVGGTNFSIANCQGNETRIDSVAPNPITGTPGFVTEWAWDYDLDGFDFDITRSYTLDPP